MEHVVKKSSDSCAFNICYGETWAGICFPNITSYQKLVADKKKDLAGWYESKKPPPRLHTAASAAHL